MKLIDLAKILRSKNAGPLYITFDVIFNNLEDLKKADKKESANILYKISLLALPIIGFLFCLIANPKATIGYEPKAKTELVQKADTLIQKADTLKNSMIKNIK